MFCDKDDWRWSEINLFYEKNLDSKENQNLADVKEYFCITMKNYIKGSDVVEIEKQTQPGHYLIRVGNDRYTMIEDGIYKCRTFQQIKSKYLQNCFVALNQLVQNKVQSSFRLEN